MNADLIANSIVEVGTARFGNRLPLTLIAGPCQLESRAHGLEMAQALKEIAARLKIGLVYKTSFDKANRTSSKSARGMGLDQALPIFADIRAIAHATCSRTSAEGWSRRVRSACSTRALRGALPRPTAMLRSQRS